jgi:hypothetical protein
MIEYVILAAAFCALSAVCFLAARRIRRHDRAVRRRLGLGD